MQQHIFEQQELQVTISKFRNLAEAQTALAEGRFDIFCASLVDLLQIHALDQLDLKIILVADTSNGADILVARKDSGMRLTDLKGARIGVAPGSTGDVLLSRALAAQSLTRDDFTVLPEEPASLFESLQKSEIQLAVAGPPYSLAFLQSPDVQVLYRSSEMPGEIISTVAATDRLLQTSPDLLRKLRDVWNQGLQFTLQHPQAASSYLAQATELPVSSIQNDYKFLPMAEQNSYLKKEGRLPLLIEQLQTNLQADGSLKTRRDPLHFLFVPTKK